jgi:hypothetical protein
MMFILEFSIEKTIIKLIGFAHKGVLKFISEKLT